MRMQSTGAAASEIGEIIHSDFLEKKKSILNLISLVLRLSKWTHD